MMKLSDIPPPGFIRLYNNSFCGLYRNKNEKFFFVRRAQGNVLDISIYDKTNSGFGLYVKDNLSNEIWLYKIRWGLHSDILLIGKQNV